MIALDNLELLIEGIDNARNIENMKLWPAVIKQLEAKDAEVRKGTAWVCGTAVQNNPEAQKAVSFMIPFFFFFFCITEPLLVFGTWRFGTAFEIA